MLTNQSEYLTFLAGDTGTTTRQYRPRLQSEDLC